MAGRFLLDTSIATEVLQGRLRVNESPHEGQVESFLCWTVIAELLYGAQLSGDPAANRHKIHDLIEICPVVQTSYRTADHYSGIKIRLKNSGTPIPENDIWVAAAAMQYGLTLATRDRHFQNVEGLKTDSW